MFKQALVRPVSAVLVLMVLVTFGCAVAGAADPLTPVVWQGPATPDGTGPGFPLTTPFPLNDDVVDNVPILLRQEDFRPAAEGIAPVSGGVQHRRVGAVELLHFTPNFAAPGGRNWEVIAAPTDDLSAGSSLGALQSITGTQEYQVPTDLNFTVVGLYDRERNEPAMLAVLEPEPDCKEIPSRAQLATMKPYRVPDACLPIQTIAELNLTGTPPGSVDLATYRLKVVGMVENPLELSYEDIRAMPSHSEVSPLICSGTFADVAEWTGVTIPTILEAAKANPDFRAIRLDASDGYFTVIRREDHEPKNLSLAYLVNGESLPLEHGYPLRAVLRGGYGSGWVKWVQQIEVLENDVEADK